MKTKKKEKTAEAEMRRRGGGEPTFYKVVGEALSGEVAFELKSKVREQPLLQ